METTITAPNAAAAANPEGGAPSQAQPNPVSGQPASFRDYLGDGDTFKPGWAKSLGGPDTLEAKFTSPKALVGSYAALEKMIGAKGIIPPGPNATPEEKSAFYKALGRPDKPEDYGITMPEKIGDKPFPKELWNAEQAGAFAKWAHEKGWSKQTVQDALEFDALRSLNGHEGLEAHKLKLKDDGIAALKSEWAGAKYDENLKLAKAGALAAGGEALANHPALGNDPIFIKAMAKVGQMIGESPAAGARGTSGTASNPAAEIAAIYADKTHPWHPANANKDPAAHKAAMDRMTLLYKQKNGEA